MKKIIIFITITLSVVVILLFIFLNGKTDVLALTTFPKAYNLVGLYQDSEELEVNIYISGKDPFLIRRENISSCYLSDAQSEDRLHLELLAIEKQAAALEIGQDLYQQYQFQFLLDFNTTGEVTIEMPQAVLNLEMLQTDAVRIGIGSFTLNKISSFGSEDLRIARLKGIVNHLNYRKTLVGIAMEIVNKSEKEMTLTGMVPLDVNIKPTTSISKLPNLQFYSGENLNVILEMGEEDTNIVLAPGTNAYFLFPITYKTTLPLNKLGFCLEYQSNEEYKKLYFNEFTFYNSYAYSAEEVSGLVIYNYENH
ncbi:MAG: hypothetical protein GX661_02670 [Acholeplasmataceae bacterium]|nr:hypothetical protein [Acholeplasmataceae bacterium]